MFLFLLLIYLFFCSGILKDYLRELPSPLITRTLYEVVLEAMTLRPPRTAPSGSNGEVQRSHSTVSLLDCLPEPEKVWRVSPSFSPSPSPSDCFSHFSLCVYCSLNVVLFLFSALSLSLSFCLCHSLPLFLSLVFSLCLYLSLSFTLFLSLSLSDSLSLPPSLLPSSPPPISLSPRLSKDNTFSAT